jgi:hypothetical protein
VRRLVLSDGTVSEFDVEQTGNPLARDRRSESGLLGTQMAGDSLGNSNDRRASSDAYVPPALDYQPPVIAVKTLQPGHTADDDVDWRCGNRAAIVCSLLRALRRGRLRALRRRASSCSVLPVSTRRRGALRDDRSAGSMGISAVGA